MKIEIYLTISLIDFTSNYSFVHKYLHRCWKPEYDAVESVEFFEIKCVNLVTKTLWRQKLIKFCYLLITNCNNKLKFVLCG